MKYCGECPIYLGKLPNECPHNMCYIKVKDPACSFGKLLVACHKQRDRARKAEAAIDHLMETKD